jgi:hypothetical protein
MITITITKPNQDAAQPRQGGKRISGFQKNWFVAVGGCMKIQTAQLK